MLLYWLFSYIIGNFLTAWWIGKWKKTDLRKERSGNLGARNAGAVLGKSAFFLTFLGDALKGVSVIYIGFYFQYSLEFIAIAGGAVILGHLFPFWLKGKGGKGIATFIGVAAAIEPTLFAILVICFIIIMALLRSATLSMTIAFSAYAILTWIIPEFASLWPLSIAILIILVRHRLDTVESWGKRWWKK
ncbi:glycerol-3-phosphate acyltransferase PlsY [Psychrobacillus sp. OK028]|uniref:glycerol-3-phosphate acyltransferase n=1 Tax=Psychrobacillus sp. OK028 TaxID=1884359 RepID=UPI00088324BD|nr:glycerol-3-phosphate acyltransferase [Psychrobacillus sp. OK028]SDN28069.1 glycerol-3-phosphate acyltransferase PlsY [Psychrobacillus sp. OK028]